MNSARHKLCLLSPIVILSMEIAKPVVSKESDLAYQTRSQQEMKRLGGKESLIAQKSTRVTGIEIKQIDDGLRVIFNTAEGERLVPLIVPKGNNLAIDILDATLEPELRNGVTEVNPAPGINRITVNQGDKNSIQVRITGENQTLSAQVVTDRDNLGRVIN